MKPRRYLADSMAVSYSFPREQRLSANNLTILRARAELCRAESRSGADFFSYLIQRQIGRARAHKDRPAVRPRPGFKFIHSEVRQFHRNAARPRPIFGTRNQIRSNRIHLDITNQSQQVTVVQTQIRPMTRLEQMPRAIMTTVESCCACRRL